jgi:hypothetical protein
VSREPHTTLRHNVCVGCLPPQGDTIVSICGTPKPTHVTIGGHNAGTANCVVCLDIREHHDECPECGIEWA